MNCISKLILNNLKFYLTSYIGIFAAVAVGSAVITGALLVGDSVQKSLKQTALQRVGWTTFALSSGEKTFNFSLAQRFKNAIQQSNYSEPLNVSAAIKLSGTVVKSDSSLRANKVNVFGVKSDFFSSASNTFSKIENGSAIVNKALAEHLNLKIGDEIIARIKKHSLSLLEIPLTLQENIVSGMRLRVQIIVSDNQMGNFSMQVSQTPPLNLFINYDELAKTAEMENRANLLVCNFNSDKYKPDLLDTALNKSLTPDDCQIEVGLPITNTIEIRSKNIFLEPELCNAARNLTRSNYWQQVVQSNTIEVLTYLANLLKYKDYSTPYSIVTAATSPFVDENIKEDEIIIIEWLAEDLHVKPGDVIQMQYFLPESASKLIEATNQFKVAKIIPHILPWFDRTLLPEIPGLAKAESTQDWNLGFPLIYKFRKKDDDYWKNYRGTPKAFLSLSAGKKIWSNRFGELTSIRFQLRSGNYDKTIIEKLGNDLIRICPPKTLGFAFEPIKENALKAAAQSQDFGGLFIGFSFFLILAVIFLTMLLFQLNLERRMPEIATYFAMGYPLQLIRRILLFETVFIIVPAAIMGAIGGTFYSKLMLIGLSTIWNKATGFSLWTFNYEPSSFIIGIIATIVSCILVIFLNLRQLKTHSIREIFSVSAATQIQPSKKSKTFSSKVSIGFIIGGLLITIGILAAIYLIISNQTYNAVGFFTAGFLILIGVLAILPSIFKKLSTQESQAITIFDIALRSMARNPKRSVLTSGILASGFFILISISIFRLDEKQNLDTPTSGTGGFSLIGESTLPIVKDLNTTNGLAYYGIDGAEIGSPNFVQFRVKEGDEASCLNLTRAQKPRILGVDWRQLSGRFTFTIRPKNYRGTNLWELLQVDTNVFSNSDNAPIEIPAIGDAASIQWAMGKKIGDTIDYVDEFGRQIKLKIVAGVENSILQGNLLISEEAFKKLFPSCNGYQFFLIDINPNNTIMEKLSSAFADYGLELTLSSKRLAEFNAVQNTYIGAFQALGGMGLLLGIIGIAIILVRNVIERRNELAILLAIGFLKTSVKQMVIIEHLFLILIGLAIGILSALIAVSPALMGISRTLPLGFLGILILLAIISGYLWTVIASRYALKGNIIDSLRTE